MRFPTKIVSGGQTGVDQAGLDAAMQLGIPCGGWCPKGRRSENGTIPASYPLTETRSIDYRERTERNVMDSDGTLILALGALSGGSALTGRLAAGAGKPCLVINLDKPADRSHVQNWLSKNRIAVLNVAGPRESQHPGIGERAQRFLIDNL